MISGTGKVFGKGRYTSYLRVLCGNREVGRSCVENGIINYNGRESHWGGFDSNFRIMRIAPSMKPVVRLVVYHCDRNDENSPLGEATLNLKSCTGEDTSLDLPIKVCSGTGEGDIVGTLSIKANFSSNCTRYLSSNETLSLDNRKVYSIGIGWDDSFSVPNIGDADFGASLVAFDKEGNYIDAACELKPVSDVVACTFKRVPVCDDEVYVTDKMELSFSLALADSNVSAFFVVLYSFPEFSSLLALKNFYCRIKENKSSIELGRYCVNIENPATACVLLRVARQISTEEPQVLQPWNACTYRDLMYDCHGHGYIIPSLRNRLSDIFPGIEGRKSDRIGMLQKDESILIEDFMESDSISDAELSIGLKLNGVSTEHDFSCIALDTDFNLVDSVTKSNPESQTGALQHGGEISAERDANDDDMLLHIKLKNASDITTYMGFYVTSHAGPFPASIEQCDAHFFDSNTKRNLCTFSLNGNEVFSKSSVLVCLMYKVESKWYFLNAGVGCADVEVNSLNNHFKELDGEKQYIQRQVRINTHNSTMMKRYGNAT
eukprot:CAMPEP_0185036686 /NCGR_PEP_ID=MMETSP1103-20130426/29979_1 /TAXON_ID=36769 /ORGANISM="Paraphysomonas bandaiensis, Strain Caron Lab Isolate" /LENGTH=547 /DNA_ID=CAMNT_0027574307 /DNA_START=68 /DNA_END=1711 /DNA_ORIENTATION=+